VLVVTFSAEGQDNCVTVGDVPYVYARTPEGSFVMPARCRHRGGPLHLATRDGDRGRLVCPWHGRITPVSRLMRQVPAVRRGNVVTAVLPDEPEATCALEHRPMSEDLSYRR
jgi:hypothetical protein